MHIFMMSLAGIHVFFFLMINSAHRKSKEIEYVHTGYLILEMFRIPTMGWMTIAINTSKYHLQHSHIPNTSKIIQIPRSDYCTYR